jgi:hypothetical protein
MPRAGHHSRIALRGVVPVAVLIVAASLLAQSRPLVAPAAVAVYQRMLPQVERIRIFDHHAHPGFADDPEVDPAPVPAGALPLRLRPDNPDWAVARRALFGAAGKALLKRRNPGPRYFNAILDRLGIETSIANRITMPEYLDAARFKWVFYVDAVMFPFDNTALAARNGDQAAFMPMQTKLVQRFEQQAGLRGLPATLDDYLAFVSRVLDDHRRRGAIAVKFEVAYFRSFVFDDPLRERAASVYEKYRSGGVPDAAEYRTFQDYVFRHVLVESGRLHLPVHLHTSAGSGDYFSLAGVSVLNLESVLRDPRYAATTFVLIHGGYPFEREAAFMTAMKNVWIDSSGTGSFLLYANEFKEVLRRWFELFPEKVTYGSDAFPIDDQIGAEETYWLGVHNARTATAAALAEMIAAREITEPQALAIARGYLHDNAARLYPPAPAGVQ